MIDVVVIIGLLFFLLLLLGLLYGSYKRVVELELAIKRHRDERGNDRCWLDDARLYAVLPGAKQLTIVLPPKEEFLQECDKYWECRQSKWEKI
jgi:hypothetical protein